MEVATTRHGRLRTIARTALALTAVLAFTASAAPAHPLKVTWLAGFKAPETPAKYDKVGVIKVGPAHARNVLVLEPGTLAGGTYFVPLARWIVAHSKRWQVWSVERRENLLEDQSEVNRVKRHKGTPDQAFNYYLGWLTNQKITHHFNFIADSSVEFAKQWGMHVAVGDLRRVIAAAHRLGGRVVLGGHSLGGSVVTAYATWNFHGRPGAGGLAGLVYIDGGSLSAISKTDAEQRLGQLNASGSSPWLVFGGFQAPFAGLFNVTGSLGALFAPNEPSVGQNFALLPPDLNPNVRVTNLAQYGYALNVGTSPPGLVAAQAHLGRGIADKGPVHGWDGSGALTPIRRFARMFAGPGINGADGTEWYFPARLTLDTGAVGNGTKNPAQRVLGVRSDLAGKLPKRLHIYAFGAALGGSAILTAAQNLAKKAGIPKRNLTLINRQDAYAHNDPNGAYPHNAFFAHLLPFLRKVAGRA